MSAEYDTQQSQRQQEERKDPASKKTGRTQRANQSKGFRPVPPRWDVTRPLSAQGMSAGYDTQQSQRQQEERKDPASMKTGRTQRANQSKGFRPVPPRWDVTRPLSAQGMSAGYYDTTQERQRGDTKGRHEGRAYKVWRSQNASTAASGQNPAAQSPSPPNAEDLRWRSRRTAGKRMRTRQWKRERTWIRAS